MRCLAPVLFLVAPVAAQDWDCTDLSVLPQQHLNACVQDFYRVADEKLNEVYQRALASLSEQSGERELLREAQRAWIPFRDAACHSEAGAMRGGSGEAMLRDRCLIRLTETRTSDLETLIGQR